MADHNLNETNEANKHQGGGTNGASSSLAGDRGDAKAQPSGYRGTNPATAGPGETHVESATPDNVEKRLDPSAPGETGTTPGSNAK